MKHFFYYILNFRLMFKNGYNIFILLIVQICFTLLLMNSTISLVFENFIQKISYIDLERYSDYAVCTVSRSILNESNENANILNSYFENIKSTQDIKDVGYINELYANIYDSPIIGASLLIMSPCVSDIMYPLSSGDWFSENNIQDGIIIGGNLNNYFKIGDKISFAYSYSYLTSDGKLISNTERYDKYVIGKLSHEKAYTLDRNVTGAPLDITMILVEQENVILMCDQDDFKNLEQMRYIPSNFIIRYENDINNIFSRLIFTTH